MTSDRIIIAGDREASILVAPALHARLKCFADHVTVVHGDCRSGIDRYADTEARLLGMPVEPHMANFNELGKKAGPIRNSEMVKAGARYVIAWPGAGPGTHDLMKKARAARIPVEERSAFGDTVALRLAHKTITVAAAVGRDGDWSRAEYWAERATAVSRVLYALAKTGRSWSMICAMDWENRKEASDLVQHCWWALSAGCDLLLRDVSPWAEFEELDEAYRKLYEKLAPMADVVPPERLQLQPQEPK